MASMQCLVHHCGVHRTRIRPRNESALWWSTDLQAQLRLVDAVNIVVLVSPDLVSKRRRREESPGMRRMEVVALDLLSSEGCMG